MEENDGRLIIGDFDSNVFSSFPRSTTAVKFFFFEFGVFEVLGDRDPIARDCANGDRPGVIGPECPGVMGG